MMEETVVSSPAPDYGPTPKPEGQGSGVIMFKWGSLQKPFRCQLCDMLFEDGGKLKAHIDKHMVNTEPSTKPFPCKICPKAFVSAKSLERHTQMHYGQVQKRCKFCYKMFANKENLDRHMRIHNGQKPHKCPQCDEQFVYRQGLDSHMVVHTGIRPFVCEVCSKGFNRKDILERHMETHEDRRKKYKCVECDKLFSHSFVLKRHARAVHSEEYESSECPICKKEIKCKENLVRHMKIHTGERPFSCTECGRKFTQRQHVIDHMVLHTGGTPHKCKFCEETFKHKRSLTRHMRRHAQHRPHSCPKCSMGFAEKSMLKKHMKKHNEKRYQCSSCMLLFKLRTSLRRHKQKVHNEIVSDNELDQSELVDYILVPETIKKTGPEKKVVVVVLKKDGDNNITTERVEGMSQAEDENLVIIQNRESGHNYGLVLDKDDKKEEGVQLENNAGSNSIAQAAEKISSQVAMETEVRMAAGQQFEDAMEEERSNIIASLIEYAEREMREAQQKAPDNQDLENGNEASGPGVVTENVQLSGNDGLGITGAQSDAEVRESTRAISEDQSGNVFIEDAETTVEEIESQPNTMFLNSLGNQSELQQLVEGNSDGNQSQIMIVGEGDDSNNHTIIIRHDEVTNDIIIEEVQNT